MVESPNSVPIFDQDNFEIRKLLVKYRNFKYRSEIEILGENTKYGKN